MTTGRNPFQEIEQFFERMGRQFETDDSWSASVESMAIDLLERDSEFVATVDLPGFEQSEVDVTVSDHTLRITAEHEQAVEEREPGQYLRKERRHESTARSITLPQEVDTDAVSATMNHGVLTVTLPKIEGESQRVIEIESA